MRGTDISRFQIALHWKYDKRFVDIIEWPRCFACGWAEEWKRKDVGLRWNNSGLERAHIVSRASGGPDTPSNYLLLCQRCHEEAPMTNRPEIMLDWARNRENYFAAAFRYGNELYKQRGISCEGIDPAKVVEFMKTVDLQSHPTVHASRKMFVQAEALAAIVKAYIASKKG